MKEYITEVSAILDDFSGDLIRDGQFLNKHKHVIYRHVSNCLFSFENETDILVAYAESCALRVEPRIAAISSQTTTLRSSHPVCMVYGQTLRL